MPELPEVETIVRALRPSLVGRTIVGVSATWENSVPTTIKHLTSRLPGASVCALNRRGKYLVAQLSNKQSLILHLKMSGDLSIEQSSKQPPRHVRTTFMLDNGHELRFNDPRKFGRVYLVDDPLTVLGALGPEPLEASFTAAQFRERFIKRRGRIKSLLLDQRCLAGVGNIYADEACFRAGIRPMRQRERLSTADLDRLYRAVRLVLRKGIRYQGASFDMVYRGGEFQNYFMVYGRTGEPCRVCRSPIRHTIMGGRSTHYCAGCQR